MLAASGIFSRVSRFDDNKIIDKNARHDEPDASILSASLLQHQRYRFSTMGLLDHVHFDETHYAVLHSQRHRRLIEGEIVISYQAVLKTSKSEIGG